MKTKKKKVLCIERNSSLAFVLKTVFKNAFDITVVANALQAIEVLRIQSDTDFIIISVEKNNYRNLALIDHLRSSTFLKNIPLIILAESITEELEDLKKDPQVINVLEKPFDPIQLVNVVEKQCYRPNETEIIFKKRKLLNLN